MDSTGAAQVYRRKGDVDHAIDDFSRAIALAPQTERAAYYDRAQLFIAKGDYARAIADFDKLLSFMPDNKAVQQQRQAAVAMQAELAKIRDAPSAPAASPGVAAAPAANPAAPAAGSVAPLPPVAAAPTPTPSAVQALQLIKQMKYADAIALLNQMLSINPNDEAALRLRTASFLARGRWAESRDGR